MIEVVNADHHDKIEVLPRHPVAGFAITSIICGEILPRA